MEQHLSHRAFVHWQAVQIQVDNERCFAQLVSEQSDKMRIKYCMRHIVQPYFFGEGGGRLILKRANYVGKT